MNEFKLFSKSRYLLKYLETNILINIPKTYSIYKLGIEKYVLELNENIIRANINEGNIRYKYQKEILISIAMIDMYLSILLEIDIVSKKKFMTISKLLNEIKKMSVSWINS